MLFDDPVLYHRGLTIFRDFHDERTFYFLPPEAPRIARSAEDGAAGDYAMRLVLFRPDPNLPPPQGMEAGGGFLNLDVDLHVDEGLLEEVTEEIQRRFGADANLVPVPFSDGSVELVLLGVGREDEGQPFVRKVAGSTVPSLYGTQRAAFSTVLDHHGAALMRQVIAEGGATMALAIYHLTYAGIGPAYNLKITVDYERVYEKLDLRLRAAVQAGNSNNAFVGRAGFHMLMEELKESRAIKVEETDPVPGENGRTPSDQEKINEIIANLMGSKWFKPTMAQVGQMADVASSSGGGSSGTTSTGTGATGTGSGGTTGGQGARPAGDDEEEEGEAEGQGEGEGQGESEDEAEAESGETALPDADWTVDSRTPASFPEGHGVTHQRDPEGTRETLVIQGDGATAKVGGQPARVRGGRLVVDVPAGERREVEITWPETSGVGEEEIFHLFFAFDQPENAAEVTAYSTGTPPAPGDDRFLSHSQAPSSQNRGPDALRAWLDGLASDRLKLRAYASYEADPRDRQHNLDLSNRRLQVARNLIDRYFPGRFDTSDTRPEGHDPARDGTVPTLTPGGGPNDSHGSKPEHRVAQIFGRPRTSGARPVLRGHLERPRAAEPGGPEPGRPEPGRPPRERETDPTKVQASFEIDFEMIEREERITATYELNSRKARTREVHPQGQLVLDAADPERYILEADGAIDFFQWLDLTASTTALWELDGIASIQIQLRYGPHDDGTFRRSGEMVLTPDQERDTWRVGVLHENDDSDRPVVFWYDYRVIVHYEPDVALGDQQGAVTSVGAPGADPEGWIRTFERNLVIHPRDVTPAMTVDVAAGLMRFDLLQRAQLTLGYGPYRQNLVLTPEKPGHRLVIRPEEGLEDAALVTEGTLFYRDGAQVPLPRREWTPRELVVINEPRENVLRVPVLLADPAGEIERARVRLRYEHENRVVEDTFELTDHAQLEEWAVRLEDPEHRAWQYQTTLVWASGDIDTGDWEEGEEGQLVVGVRAEEVIPVRVTWLVPPTGDLLAVKVELEYDDEANDVHWDHAELIRGEHPGTFDWPIPIQDPEARSYRYRVTEYRATGPQEGAWTESSSEELVLMPGS